MNTTEEDPDSQLKAAIEASVPGDVGKPRQFDTFLTQDSDLQKKLEATERELLAHQNHLKEIAKDLGTEIYLSSYGSKFYPQGCLHDVCWRTKAALQRLRKLESSFSFLWKNMGSTLGKNVSVENPEQFMAATISSIFELRRGLNDAVGGEVLLRKEKDKLIEKFKLVEARHLQECREIIASKDAMAEKLRIAEEKLAALTTTEQA